MDATTVLMTHPMIKYLQDQLASRFNVIKLWTIPHQNLNLFSNSIQAVVCNATIGADSKLIDSLPKLEIVSTFSVGLDKIDLNKCKEKEIRVTNTPDVLSDDVADLAIGLTIATLRRICVGDRFVKSGKWTNGDFGLCSKVL